MHFRNMRIGMKLAFSFGIVLAILTVVAIGSNFLNQKYKGDMVSNIELVKKKTDLVFTMRSSLLQSGVALRNLGLEPGVDEAQAQEKTKREQDALYIKASQELEAQGVSQQEKALLDKISGFRAELKKPLEFVYAMTLSQQSGEAAKVILSTIDVIGNKMLAAMTELVAIQEKAYNDHIEQSVEADRKLAMILYSVFAITVLFSAMLAFYITSSITKPLGVAVAIAESVAEGDLTSEVDTDRKDEIGRLLTALQRMNGNLSSIVTQVRSGTDSIATASAEITSGNLDLSSRTEQQAASLEETASSMEELTSTVKQNADNARQANQMAMTASGVAVKGGEVVAQVVVTMGSINESSKKIADIISVIDGIAFQTNILALNAAVEAARAGEQGRGFAVVASEVRNLAQRSAAAAKEIKGLIGTSVEKVDAGSKLVAEAGATMEEIVTSVKRVTDIMAEIMAASQEQSAGIEQVNQAIVQMETTTQQNASLVEEAAAASQALQEQAGYLAREVAVFKVVAV